VIGASRCLWTCAEPYVAPPNRLWSTHLSIRSRPTSCANTLPTVWLR